MSEGWEGQAEGGRRERDEGADRRLQMEVEMRDRVANKWQCRGHRRGSGWTRQTIGREGATGGQARQALVGSFLLGTVCIENEVLVLSRLVITL